MLNLPLRADAFQVYGAGDEHVCTCNKEEDAAAIVERCNGLEAILSRLPKTADGVPVICDGMTIFCPKGHENKLTHATGRAYCITGDCYDPGCQGDSSYRFEQCLSQRPA